MFRRHALVTVIALATCAGALGAVPGLISHQGKLLDNAGDPVANGVYAMTFRLYDACTGGNLLLTDTHSVQVTNGIYSVSLGGGSVTSGLESDLAAVFRDHDLVCLGTTVGADSEMVPRQPITSAGFALRAATADGIGTAIIKQGNGVHFCGADWDDNGTPGENADVVACLQAALGAITTAEDGNDNAVEVRLPGGRFDVSAACSSGSCFELKSGITIIGEMPRLRYIDGAAPDLDMQPNGGTWLDPGPTNTLFTGQHLRGVALEKFGVVNFGRVAAFGGDGEDGISFSTIRDIYVVGTDRTASPRSTVAFVFYNIQHLRMDHVKVFEVERGLHVIGQKTEWQPANSVFTDFYVYTYPNPQGGIKLEVLKPTDGEAVMMNYITFVRPQVNGFTSNGGPGVTGLWLKGYSDTSPVQMMWFVGADIEGEYEHSIKLEQADHNWIQIAALPGATNNVLIDADSQFNTVASLHDRVKLSVAPDTHNMFMGHFDSTDESLISGLFWDRQENRWSASLGPSGQVSSGSGFLWYDDGFNRWRVKEGEPGSPGDGVPVVTGTGASANHGPAIWVETGVTCSAACSNAGMAECVDGWQVSAAVGCASSSGRRICSCR